MNTPSSPSNERSTPAIATAFSWCTSANSSPSRAATSKASPRVPAAHLSHPTEQDKQYEIALCRSFSGTMRNTSSLYVIPYHTTQ